MEKYSSSSSITRQLQVVFAISILILLISSYASFFSNHKLIESSQLVNHTNEVIQTAEALILGVKDAESGQRGYIITHDAAFLKPFEGAYERVGGMYEHLRRLTTDNPKQQAHLNKVRVLVDQRFEQMRKVLEQSNTSSLEDRTAMFVDSHKEMSKGLLIMTDLRKAVEDIKAEERRLLKQRTQEQDTYIKYTPITVIAAALISILLSVMAYFRIKNDLDARIRKQQEEERKYIETTHRIAAIEGVTQMLAGGDFSARSKDEAQDELGRISAALNGMAEALETNFAELKKRNWMQTGAVTVSESIRSERFLKNVGSKIIHTLSTYLKAAVGTIYFADKNLTLRLQGSYAIADAPEEIAAGEGLAGQAIVNGEIIVSDELPSDYLRVSSSIGSTAPVYSLVVPLIHGENSTGVLELGFLRKPTEMEIEFLENSSESLAISLRAAFNYERMQELLEETQAQSEELQAQHNELENINVELEAQTEKLQASEEELRVQQEELQQANQELEERSRLLEERNHLILERNLEVQKKAEELAQTTKYKSEFLANMSHELRTPLNSILLLSRLLSENKDENLSADQVEYAQVIQSSGNGLLALIDEILDLSKIEAGKMQLEYETVPVAEITEDLRVLFEPLAKEKGLAFRISVAEGVKDEVETDKLRLEQIIKNLLSNAFKFTREGSVELKIARDEKRMDYLKFSVEDTGIGISAEKQALIFEAFQQADGSTRRKYGGTGLGLSISKELARLLGGDISVQSESDKGSKFSVTIPVRKELVTKEAQEEPANRETEEPKVPVPAEEAADEFIAANIPESISDDRNNLNGHKIILIVEDDTSFAKSLLEFTRRRGYKGIVSVRGDEGLELAKRYKPTGILLDIQLPVKSGWQVMDELKKDPQTRHIPVHIMSSHSVRKESLMKGAVDFINKPVAFEQMQEVFGKLEHVLNNKTKKVLIVEDNPKHAKALAYFLETFGLNTEIKNSVSEGVDALKKNADCVILDMGIPDTKAYNVLESIKDKPGLENLPIIVFTGKSLSMAEEQRIKQYADSIVVKTAHSYQRILDEVSLFLHLMDEQKTKSPKGDLKKLGILNEVLKGKTVLIVDDDVRNIFSLTKTLERVEMNVVTAIDGKDAIEKLKEHNEVDVVLLDMMMPLMDGYETAARIRQNTAWKKLPVIAVTAKAMTGDREKCIQAGASDYITKPVDMDQLLSLLRVWLYEKSNGLNV